MIILEDKDFDSDGNYLGDLNFDNNDVKIELENTTLIKIRHISCNNLTIKSNKDLVIETDTILINGLDVIESNVDFKVVTEFFIRGENFIDGSCIVNIECYSLEVDNLYGIHKLKSYKLFGGEYNSTDADLNSIHGTVDSTFINLDELEVNCVKTSVCKVSKLIIYDDITADSIVSEIFILPNNKCDINDITTEILNYGDDKQFKFHTLKCMYLDAPESTFDVNDLTIGSYNCKNLYYNRLTMYNDRIGNLVKK